MMIQDSKDSYFHIHFGPLLRLVTRESMKKKTNHKTKMTKRLADSLFIFLSHSGPPIKKKKMKQKVIN